MPVSSSADTFSDCASLLMASSSLIISAELIRLNSNVPLLSSCFISATGIIISEYLSIFSQSAYEYTPLTQSSSDIICHEDNFLSMLATPPTIISFSLALVIATYSTRSSSDIESLNIFLAIAPLISVGVLVCLVRLT